MNSLLATYIPLVDFIADIIGPDCEVILHDITRPESSVVAIRNGYISGRQIGAPLTAFGLELLERKLHVQQHAVVNYLSYTDRHEKLRASTYFIRDQQGALLGMLCVNIKMSGGDTAGAAAEALSPAGNETGAVEKLSTSFNDVIESALRQLTASYGTEPERLSGAEKITLIQQLRARGIFQIKGAVAQVAQALNLSQSTVYRYLSVHGD